MGKNSSPGSETTHCEEEHCSDFQLGRQHGFHSACKGKSVGRNRACNGLTRCKPKRGSRRGSDKKRRNAGGGLGRHRKRGEKRRQRDPATGKPGVQLSPGLREPAPDGPLVQAEFTRRFLAALALQVTEHEWTPVFLGQPIDFFV